MVHHLVAVEAELVEARVVALPGRLGLNLVPLARGHGGHLLEFVDMWGANRAVLDARVELVSVNLDHAGGDAMVTGRSR